MTKLYAGAALIAMAALLGGTYYVIQSNQSADIFAECRGGAVGGGAIGGPMSLVNGDGQTVTDAEIFTKPTLLYFGYTFCPDVCPTELQTVAAALERLGPLAERVAPLFITIDPERDTPAAVGEYVKLFDERIVGLSGSKEQVAAAAKAYRVYFARARSKDATDYLMDHSSFIYLVGPDGGFRALFRQGVGAQDLADAIRTRMGG
jgi:protein SCO1/2